MISLRAIVGFVLAINTDSLELRHGKGFIKENLVKIHRDSRGRSMLFSGDWVPVGGDIPDDGDGPGSVGFLSMSKFGRAIAAGSGPDGPTGAVQVYELDNKEEWQRKGSLLISSGSGTNSTPCEVSDDGNLLVIGGPPDTITILKQANTETNEDFCLDEDNGMAVQNPCSSVSRSVEIDAATGKIKIGNKCLMFDSLMAVEFGDCDLPQWYLNYDFEKSTIIEFGGCMYYDTDVSAYQFEQGCSGATTYDLEDVTSDDAGGTVSVHSYVDNDWVEDHSQAVIGVVSHISMSGDGTNIVTSVNSNEPKVLLFKNQDGLQEVNTYDAERGHISNDGQYLAVSSCNENVEASNFLVYKKGKNGSFEQFGKEVKEEGCLLSLATDSEGVIVAVADPTFNENKGKVSIYKVTERTSLFIKNKIGYNDEKLGSSLKVSIDGKRIVIGSVGAFDNRGRVDVHDLELVSDGFPVVGSPIIGRGWDNAGHSLAIDESGERVAYGYYDKTNGIPKPFEAFILKEQTHYPTDSPTTAAPTKVGETPAPTPERTEHAINYITGSGRLTKTDDGDTAFEVKYNISPYDAENVKFVILKSGCDQEDDKIAGGVKAVELVTPVTVENDSFVTLTMNLATEQILKSALWNDPKQALEFCISTTMELDVDGKGEKTAIAKHSKRLDLTYDLNAGFISIDDSEAEKIDTTVAKQTFELRACTCEEKDSTYVCLSDAMFRMSQDFELCVHTISTKMKIQNIISMEMLNSKHRVEPIQNGKPNLLTFFELEKTYTSDEKVYDMAVISTKAIPMFFQESNPEPIIVKGKARLTFKDASSRSLAQKVRSIDNNSTIDSGDVEEFELSVSLIKDEIPEVIESTDKQGSFIVVVVATFVFVIFVLFLWRFRKAKK